MAWEVSFIWEGAFTWEDSILASNFFEVSGQVALESDANAKSVHISERTDRSDVDKTGSLPLESSVIR